MKDFQKIIEKIARDNGTTPENVLAEMRNAIEEAYNHHAPEAQPLWDKITSGGAKPTPEAFVLQIARILDEETKP